MGFFKPFILFLVFFSGAVLLACSRMKPDIESGWLDHQDVLDPSLTDSTYRVTTRFPTPNAETLAKPVILAAHGYTASTYEWQEFKTYAEATSNVLVSLVLLGGHGRSYEDFKKSTWEDWQAPILEEYKALVTLGYKNISVLGASTGGTLLLEAFSERRFDSFSVQPKAAFFVDSLVVAKDKMLYLVPYVHYFLSDLTLTDMDPETRLHWYSVRPVESLRQLEEVMSLVRSNLEDGIVLPPETVSRIYQAQRDPTVDSVSALLIYNGLTLSTGEKSTVQTMDSDFHVFTRLQGRDSVTTADQTRQKHVFDEMINLVSN